MSAHPVSHVTKAFPVFLVRNMDEALAYYQDKLGFTVAWKWGGPVSRAGVTLGEIEIQLDCPGATTPPGPSVVYCHMTGVRAYFEACQSRGAVIVRGLKDQPWGMKDFRIGDPSGNQIGFGEEL